MSRFFVPEDSVCDGKIFITGKEAHHIIDVMRLKKSGRVVVFDGTGNEYSCVIKEIAGKNIYADIVDTRLIPATGAVILTLIQAIPKKDKMEYIIEKATELGVHNIVPVITGRTIVKWDDAKRGDHVNRWREIAKVASKQCGRADIPVISEIKKIDCVLRDFKDKEFKLIAALSEGVISLRDALKSYNKERRVAIAIGPEGDFTPDEVETAKANGFKAVSLGARVLKSDTAPLAALSILNYELENR